MSLLSVKSRTVAALLGALAVLICAQDTSTVLFPSHGNGSSPELDGKKIESTLPPDVTHPSPLLAQAFLPSNYFIPEMIRPPIHHRSEGFPYGLEYPNLPHPIIPPVPEYPVGLSPKHLVIVSFIGLLLLFTIIQNTIIGTKRKDALVDALSTRRKRQLYSYDGINSMTPEAEAIWNDDARVRCIQRTICLENKKLFKDMGTVGKALAKYLTQVVRASLDSTSGWDRLIDDAAAAGIRGDDCNVLYRSCSASRPLRGTSGQSAETAKEL